MEENKQVIPIFFAIDDYYIPFFSVALTSLIENSSQKYDYLIWVLHTNVTEENIKKIYYSHHPWLSLKQLLK